MDAGLALQQMSLCILCMIALCFEPVSALEAAVSDSLVDYFAEFWLFLLASTTGDALTFYRLNGTVYLNDLLCPARQKRDVTASPLPEKLPNLIDLLYFHKHSPFGNIRYIKSSILSVPHFTQNTAL